MLSHVEEMLPPLRELAVGHVSYGAERRHDALVGETLAHMPAVISRPRFDAPMCAAWGAAHPHA